MVERLQLDQKLVDHAGDSLAPAALTETGPRRPDGVDLLDESDGASFAPCGFAQLREEGPDLPVGLTVEHGLEGRGRHKEERHPGFPGQSLGQVGLPGPGRPLEEDALPRRPAHFGPEGGMGEEKVEGADGLLDHDRQPFDIVEADVDLLGPVADVRRAPRDQHRDHHHRPHQKDYARQRQILALGPGQVRPAQDVPGEDREPEPHPDEHHDHDQLREPAPPRHLPSHPHIGDFYRQDPLVPQLADVHTRRLSRHEIHRATSRADLGESLATGLATP